ncbi:alkaline phosphatase [Puia sp.]|jgi:alkaline phosphatase|uniref:alkaline phosphatase n=1 Tax=Puia sp. TaxID=2045100 RepID=UPI002F3F99B1
MKKWFFLVFTALALFLTVRPIASDAQPLRYTVANTHSHNDYEQAAPFWAAWQQRFGSIEADIWLVQGKVIIGHDTTEIKAGRTLEEYYVKPLLACIERNHGYPYADSTRRLQILIDVKADSVAALAALIALLDKYPALERCACLKWVISGNRPDPAQYPSYPSFIAFDGILHARYTPAELAHIAMMSDDLRYYTRWDSRTGLPDSGLDSLKEAITQSHDLHLPVRLWDAPDFPVAWNQLMRLKVDYLNTDHITDLAAYLNSL